MNSFEKIVVALLAVIAIEGAVTAYEIRQIARNGFEVELTEEQAKAVADKREAERQKKQKMLADERAYIRETANALAFLSERRFKVSTWDGGLLDGWPHTYVRIEKGGRWVEIEGSSVRRTDGKLNQVSPYIANYVSPTMEELIETIAEW